ncbi:hypothetical protein ACFQ0K_19420 [Nocardioides caeni]|uniref:Uncharacterized protein n=1 Tax=Nocardioides caeni TaxID=574700 RepID=A0A4S8NE28_9ACTN|nr:hypothetical protein [Nocardioides caeni]THV14797.1 hypothetical protein E9934_09130 [Nocardioides caeni]
MSSQDDSPYAEQPSEEEAREEEQAYADSATAVSPDTQHPDPGVALPEGTPPGPITVDDPDAEGDEIEGSDAPRPAGHADEDRN